MQLEIQDHHSLLDAPARRFAERRTRFALGRFGGLLRRVTIHFRDENGDRGGADVRCRIIARLASGGHLIAEATELTPQEAISRAAERIGRAVGREISRRREGRREPEPQFELI